MPNLVNELLLDELKRDFASMGSCLLVAFDKLTVADADDLRSQFRDAGMKMRVVKNRLALRVFEDIGLDVRAGFAGKTGIVMAPEERAIAAAKIVREVIKKKKKDAPLTITGAVIEGRAYVGPVAETIADMPDKDTVRGMLAGAISGVARGLAMCIQSAGPAGLARVIQARCDK